MAVSKIAVIALVGILAIPILLGYAFNLSEVSVTDYKPSSESINVTPLLQNGTYYSYANANPYQLNSNFDDRYRDTSDMLTYPTPTSPVYNQNTTVKTPYGLNQYFILNNWGDNGFAVSKINIKMVYDIANVNLTGRLTDQNNATVNTYNKITEVYFSTDDNKMYITYMDGADFKTVVVNASTTYHMYYTRTPATANVSFIVNRVNSSTSTYADLSQGYYFAGMYGQTLSRVNLPDNSYSVLLTVNLDSITAATYRSDFNIGPIALSLQKVTNNGIPAWALYERYHNPMLKVADLYYDSSRSDNTYQFNIRLTPTGTYLNTSEYYDPEIEINYIGGWPTLIGQANVYKSYTYEYPSPNGYLIPSAGGLNHITFLNVQGSTRTPTIRLDAGQFKAFEYPVIESRTYTPADFKDNPLTTISNISQYGDSLSFAGNTYVIDSSGNITLGTHKIPVNNLILKSVPVTVGYENRIGDTTISISAEPSTITFNGKWAASIETTSQTATTYTKTEWTAGHFAWDGMDHNFLIVGLITCLGVFIALGIYLRKTGKGLMPLLIVCGCAAGLFFCMI